MDAALGQEFEAPSGLITIDPENHHAWLQPRIGKVRDDGEFDVVWQASGPVKPDPYLTTYGFADFWLD